MAANAGHGIDIIFPTTLESCNSRVSLPLDMPSYQPVCPSTAPLDIVHRAPAIPTDRRDLERQLNVDSGRPLRAQRRKQRGAFAPKTPMRIRPSCFAGHEGNQRPLAASHTRCDYRATGCRQMLASALRSFPR
jgi:hypothetical protein